MTRALLAALAIAIAPIQCGHDPDPTLRHEDEPGDALWDLAMKFRANGDEAAARRTLEQLVQKYPSSRRAPAARDELASSAGPEGERAQTKTIAR